MKKIFIYVNNGEPCELRLLDATKIYNYLVENNHKIVDHPAKADVIIFIACASFTKVAEESLQKIEEFQKYNAELIVTGCITEIKKEELSKMFKGKIINTMDLDKIDHFFPENKIKFKDVEDENLLFKKLQYEKPLEYFKRFLRKISRLEKSYIKIREHIFKNLFNENYFSYKLLSKKQLYYIRISQGCSGVCSYCSIPHGYGGLKSKPIEECIREFKKGLSKGYMNFILIADDAGTYGLDINSSLPELLDKMIKIEGRYELSILGISPQWLSRDINDFIRIVKTGKLVSIGIPIQSGSSRILKLMNRYSETGKIKETFLRLKEEFPNISLHTHYLLGFPSETETEFLETLNFIKEINFSIGVILPFSSKTGVIGENIKPKLSKTEIYQRMKYATGFLKKEGYNVKYINVNSHFLVKKDYGVVFFKT